MNYEKLKQTYAIPICQNATAIGYYINVKNQKETVFWGDIEDIKEMICTGSSLYVFQVKSRKLGTFFNDIEHSISSDTLKIATNGFNKVLKNGLGNKDSKPYLLELDNIYKKTLGDNIITSYIISYIYNNFVNLHNQQNDNISLLSSKKYFEKFSSEFNKTVENLLEDSKNIPILSINNANMIKFEGAKAVNDFSDLKVLPKRSRGTWDLYYVSTGSLLSLIHTYYDQLKAANLFIRHCAICKKIVILDKVNNYVVCENEECQKARNRNAVKKSRSKVENGSLRSLYEDFYNRINSARNNKLNKISRNAFDEQFRCFCKEAKAKRKDLELESDIESDNNAYQNYSVYLDNAENNFKLLIKKLKAGEDNA